MRRVMTATLAVSLLAACGSSESDAGPSDRGVPLQSTTPDESLEPVETDSPAQDVSADAAAEAALLTLSDFPAGWSEVPDEDDESGEKIREQARECRGQTSAELFNIETEAQTGDFTDPVDESTVGHTVALAPTVESAKAYMAGGSADGVAECLTTVYRRGFADLVAADEEMEDAELGEITVGALNIGNVGERVFAYRITVPISLQGITVDFFADFVAVRVGRSVSGLDFYSQFDPTPIERITEYTTLAASRLPG